MEEQTPTTVILMSLAVLLGALGFTGAATWFLMHALPELQAINLIGYACNYILWACHIAEMFPESIRTVVLLLLLGLGIVIVLIALYAISECKRRITNYVRRELREAGW